MRAKVFISYSHRDKGIACKLNDFLEAHKVQVIIDLKSLEAGNGIADFIAQSIRESDYTLSIISENSLKSGWVALETTNTFIHENIENKNKFIACYLDNSLYESDYVEEVIEELSIEIKVIRNKIANRMVTQSGTQSRDLNKILERHENLKNNIDQIIGRLKEFFSVPIDTNNLTESFSKLLKAIQRNRKKSFELRLSLSISFTLILLLFIGYRQFNYRPLLLRHSFHNPNNLYNFDTLKQSNRVLDSNSNIEKKTVYTKKQIRERESIYKSICIARQFDSMQNYSGAADIFAKIAFPKNDYKEYISKKELGDFNYARKDWELAAKNYFEAFEPFYETLSKEESNKK